MFIQNIAYHEDGNMGNKHALIIDDDAYNVYIMERLLDRENISYTAVTDTASLELTLSGLSNVDIVFLDLEMPKRDGYELLRVLADYIHADVPIVACTVHTAEIRHTRSLGFTSFIAKPLDMERFPDQLRRIFGGEPVWEAQ